MNYIWDLAIKAGRQGISSEKIVFRAAASCSPYMELAFDELNTRRLEDDPCVELNPYYRFCDIFKKMFGADFHEQQELREVLFDIVVHYLLELDLRQGLSKTEYYGAFIRRDLAQGVFGKALQESLDAFDEREQHLLVMGIISLQRTRQASVHLLKKQLRGVFVDSIVYYRREDAPEILIYLGVPETEVNRCKIDALLALFMPLGFAYRLYWEQHFGIIDMDKTMRNEQIIIY